MRFNLSPMCSTAASFLLPCNGRVDDDIYFSACLLACLAAFAFFHSLHLRYTVYWQWCHVSLLPSFRLHYLIPLCCRIHCIMKHFPQGAILRFPQPKPAFSPSCQAIQCFRIKGAHRQDSQLCAGPHTANMKGSSLFAIGFLTNSSHTLRFRGFVHWSPFWLLLCHVTYWAWTLSASLLGPYVLSH